MISNAAFQIQVNRHMNATECLINTSYGWWLENGDSLVEAIAAFSSELTADIQKAAHFIKSFWMALQLAIASANEKVEEFIEERTDTAITKTPDVSWHEALTAALFQDLILPVVSTWMIANIWETAVWIDINRRF